MLSFSLFVLFLLFAAYFLVRNELVYHEFGSMIDRIDLVEDHTRAIYLFGLLKEVSYNKMMLHFWVYPIGSMWPEELKELKK